MKKFGYFLLIFILVVACGGLGYYAYLTQNQLKNTNAELDQTKTELEQAKILVENANIENSELDPCPFCGSDDVIFCVGNFTNLVCVNCKTCGANTAYNFKSKEEAKKVWNSLPREKDEETDKEDLENTENN